MQNNLAKKIAVAIPCYNEAASIATVINDLKTVLPGVPIHVFDNSSTDGCAEFARKAGAEIHFVRKQGKGNVIRAIFDTLVVDALIIIDGDDTYPAEEVTKLLEPVLEGKCDMAVGNRLKYAPKESLRMLNRFGNRIIVSSVNLMFKVSYKDILSGFRVINRHLVESVPLLTEGFEVETELTLQAMETGMHIIEIPISYKNRPEDSCSKLMPFRDGYKIMLTAAVLMRDHHPMRLFSAIGFVFILTAFISGFLASINYFIPMIELPIGFFQTILLLFAPMGVIMFGIGITLNAINSRFREMKQIVKRLENSKNNSFDKAKC